MEEANIIFSPRQPLEVDVDRELGRRLENLWDEQNEPSLTAIQRLNSCLEKIPVEAFPVVPNGKVVEINSDASLAEAVQLLAKHKILSAPVRDIGAHEDASWIDKYIGIVEFAGIAVWLLHQSEIAALGVMGGSSGTCFITGGRTGGIGSVAFGTPLVGAVAGTAIASAAGCGMAAALGPGHSGPEAVAVMGGDFFETLTSSEFYRKTKVKDIAGSFRWAPFLPIQKSDSFLTMLLLLSKYRMKSLPVVDIGEGKIENIITQSAVVNEDQPVLQAFKVMREKGVGGLPVIEKGGNRPIGNISVRDVQFLLMAPEIYKDFRSVTAKDFLTAVRAHLQVKQESSPILEGVITCQKRETVEEVILKLDSAKIQRIYVVDDKGDLEGVVTLRDIISKFVQEPPGYFGDFFYQVVPSPKNSRV